MLDCKLTPAQGFKKVQQRKRKVLLKSPPLAHIKRNPAAVSSLEETP